jgi:hypothetical protein
MYFKYKLGDLKKLIVYSINFLIFSVSFIICLFISCYLDTFLVLLLFLRHNESYNFSISCGIVVGGYFFTSLLDGTL